MGPRGFSLGPLNLFFCAINSKVDKTTQEQKNAEQDTSIAGLNERITALEGSVGEAGQLSVEKYGYMLPSVDLIKSRTITFPSSVGSSSDHSDSGTFKIIQSISESIVSDGLYLDSSSILKRCTVTQLTFNSSGSVSINRSFNNMSTENNLASVKSAFSYLIGYPANWAPRDFLIGSDKILHLSYTGESDSNIITGIKSISASISGSGYTFGINPGSYTVKPIVTSATTTVTWGENKGNIPSSYKQVALFTN